MNKAQGNSLYYRPETVSGYVRFLMVKDKEKKISTPTRQRLRSVKSKLKKLLLDHGIHNRDLVAIPADCHNRLNDVVRSFKNK
jgi:hypothetical protein